MESNTALIVKNNQGWSIQAECSSTGISIRLLDRWNLPSHPVTLIFTKIQQEDMNHPLPIFLEREIRKLNKDKRSYGFQVYKQNDRFYLVFDDYGIKGGGREKGVMVAIGATITGTGAYCLGRESKIGYMTVVGSALIGAGVNGALYAYNSNEEEIGWKNYIVNGFVGATSGFFSGLVSLANPASYVVEQGRTSSVINSALSNLASNLAHLFGKREEFTTKKLLFSVAGSAIGSCASLATREAIEKVFTEVRDNLWSATIQGGLRGSLEGLVGASTNKVIENRLNKKKWYDQLGISSAIATFVGGISCGVRSYYKCGENPLLTAQKKFQDLSEKHNQLIEQSKQLNEEWLSLSKSERAAERKLNELKSINNDSEAIEQAKQLHSQESEKLWQCEQRTFLVNDQIDDIGNKLIQEQDFIRAAQTCTQFETATEQLKKYQGYLEEIEGMKIKIQANLNESRANVEELRNSQNQDDTALSEAESLFSHNTTTLAECLKAIDLVKQYLLLFQQMANNLSSQPDFEDQVTLYTQRLSEEDALERKAKVTPPVVSFSELFSTFPVVKVAEVSDVDWFELVKHVVLVHTLNLNPIVEAFPEEFCTPYYQGNTNLLILHKAFTHDGEIGYHLKYKEKQFKDPLVRRPQIHWSWNQQVQSHTSSDWTNSTIAILEPLSTFEQPEQSSAFGIAPYDTMTFGSHMLSEQSTVLVPQDIEEEAKEHLSGFKGKIATYHETSLRSAIHNQIKSQYSETWHLVDPKNGQEVAENEYYNSGDTNYNNIYGCFKKTCLRKTDGQLITLITEEGSLDEEIHAEGIRQAKNAGKFIGLHHHSTTAWLEDKASFQALREFTENPVILNENKKSFFAGYINQQGNTSKLCILDAFHFYNVMNQYANPTRSSEIGKYILHEAFFADIVSILLTRLPEHSLDFTRDELALMIATHREKWLTLLHSLSGSNETETIFTEYCSSLEKAIRGIYSVREKMRESFDVDSVFDLPTSIEDLLEGRVLQKEWSAVLGEKMDTNFDSRWPLTKPERKFLKKFKNLLPLNEVTLSSSLKTITQMSQEDGSINEKLQKLSYIKYGLEFHLKATYYSKLSEID